MRRAAAWIPAILLAASSALGWDTRTVKNPDGSESWLSAYEGGPPANLLPAPAGFTRNEHAELAHLALHELGIAEHFGIMTSTTGLATLDVVDLNAALFRRGLMAEARFGDDTSPGSVLEERLLPAPAHFAGLPDFTFAVYDWINKSTLCPSLAPGSFLFDRCHVYFGGYLTVFNSTHFGSQATLVYARYHQIALGLAARAQALRTTLEAGLPGDAAAHELYVKERELEALAYEGFAQHFLQDRWSIGHMWERWNGPDQRRSAGIVVGSLVGGIAGLIHGSEALTGLPDPMSSPPVGGVPPAALPVLWRSTADGVNHPGIGDERLLDMYDGAFGMEYGVPDLPLAVPLQRATMLDCSKAGWAEVIQAFGTNAMGGYGAWKVPLADVTFPPVVANPLCWDNWATNDAIRAGWVDDVLVTTADDLARSVASIDGIPGAIAGATLDALRSELTALTARIRARAKALPASTNLARGQIGAVAGVEPGNAYARDAGGLPDPAEYAEPEVLDDLPDDDAERGRDKQAVFGFFNRAHADFWCTGVAARLARLRGSPEPIDQAACAYLADRVYKGTDPVYRGRRREQRTVAGAESDPICRYHGVETAGVDDTLPYHLHPGYVTVPDARGAYSYRSLEAWCRKLPVVNVAPCPDESPPVGDADWDVAAHVEVAGGTVTLRGFNFGASGTVAVGASEGAGFPVDVSVAGWGDTEIRLAVPAGLLTKGDWFLQVRPGSDPSRWSIGRAILRVGDPCLGNHPLVGIWFLSTKTTPPETQLGYHFLPDGSVMQDTVFPRWVRIGTWSAGEDTVTITPCPYAGDNAFAGPDFTGTWSAHPVTEGFGIASCFPPNQDVCPAMSGTLTLVFAPFGPPLMKGPVDSRATSIRGYFPLGMTLLKDPRCHGGCGETWEYQFPSTCARIDQVCSRSGPACGGDCPEGFSCVPTAVACACVED